MDTTVDGDYRRIETRTTTVVSDIGWLQRRHARPRLESVVVVESLHEADGVTATATPRYVASAVLAAVLMGPVVRAIRP